MLWAVPLAGGSEFRVSWIHSVSRRWVTERFRIDSQDRLCLHEMILDHEGPNLPSGREDGLTWRFRGDKAIVSGYALCLERLNLAVAPDGHRIEADRWEWDMLAAMGADRHVILSAERTPFVLLAWCWLWLKLKGRS